MWWFGEHTYQQTRWCGTEHCQHFAEDGTTYSRFAEWLLARWCLNSTDRCFQYGATYQHQERQQKVQWCFLEEYRRQSGPWHSKNHRVNQRGMHRRHLQVWFAAWAASYHWRIWVKIGALFEWRSGGHFIQRQTWVEPAHMQESNDSLGLEYCKYELNLTC